MNGDAVSLLTGSSLTATISLRDDTVAVHLLSAYEGVVCHARARGLASRLEDEGAEPEAAAALAQNACLAAMCLQTADGNALYKDGSDALKALSFDELALIALEYGRLRRQIFDLDELDDAEVSRLKKACGTLRLNISGGAC